MDKTIDNIVIDMLFVVFVLAVRMCEFNFACP